MHPLIQNLLQAGPVLTDGAWGTQLQARGLKPGEVPDLWNLSNASAVKEVAAAYVAAGSRVILTNTFGANRIRLADGGVMDRVAEINAAGVAISLEAAGDRARVFASMGPTGKLILNGDVTEEELISAFTEQAQAIAKAGAHAIVVETLQDLDEARIAIAAAKATGLPVVGSMVFDSGANKDRTMMGTTPEQAAEALIGAGADVIGANCGQGIGGFVELCRRFKAAAQGCPIWMKANAGLPENLNGKYVYRTSPADFASYMPALIDAGANFVGGCCGTSPEFIRTVRALLDARK